MRNEKEPYNKKAGVKREDLEYINEAFSTTDGRVIEGDADVFSVRKKENKKDEKTQQKGGGS